MPRRVRCALLGLFPLIALTGCAGDDDSTAATSTDPATSTTIITTTTVTPTTATPTTQVATTLSVADSTSAPRATSTTPTTVGPATTSTTTTTSTTSTSTSTSTTTTTVVPATTADTGTFDLGADMLELGRSVEGRPILAERIGTPGGRRVLVIGVIHGNEDAGTAIIDELRLRGAPPGVELWLVESMNPDGQAAQDRHNANQVDLNRNFPYNWNPLGQPGDGQYAGTGPASEPETQAIVAFIEALRPDIALWYHQDLYVINPATGRDGRIRARYAELTGLPLGAITGGTYTGIAATWARNELAPQGSVAFIVELGASLTGDETVTHAEAVRTIAVEG